MDKFNNKSRDQETVQNLLEYDINDVELSIQETIKEIEKIALKRSEETDRQN